MSHVKKIVKPKDITQGIARTMVLNLRPFDIVEGVGFNELFILVINPFSNPNSFGNLDSFENLDCFENPDKFENLKIYFFRVPVPIPKKFRIHDPSQYFGFSHISM